MNKEKFIQYMKKQYQDKQQYQTIEYCGEVVLQGTEKCWKSWENIQKLKIDWSGKHICDIGSYFGYFSTKALQAGAAQITAIDQNDYLLKVYSKVLKANGFSNFRCISRKFIDGVVMPDEVFDIILILNVLHHIKKASGNGYSLFLKSLFKAGQEFIFEINQSEIDDVVKMAKQNNCTEINRIESHRKTKFGNRWILYFVKI